MEQKQLIHLVVAAQNGDGKAMNELFNAFYNDVYYFALKTVKDPETACDITQETFVTIITSLKELKEPAAFVTWMKQIAYSQCTRYFRKKKDVLVDEDEDGNTVFDTMAEERAEFIPDESLDEEDFRKTILQMMDDLAPEQRAALLLYYYDELSVKQIAEIQGVSIGTVKSRLNYARKAIKGSVEDYEKKNNVKIHSVAILPLLLWLLQTGEEAVMPAVYVEAAAAGISTATGVAISVSATTAASTTAAASAVVAASTGIGAKLSVIPLATKIAAGVTGLLLVTGGVVAATLPKEPPTVPAAVIQTQPITSQEPVTVPTHPLPTITPPLVTEPPVTDPLPTEPPVTEPPITEPPVQNPPITDPPVEDPPAEREAVPEGCTYIMADGTVIQAGEAMPAISSNGEQLISTDYAYTYRDGGWSVVVNDTTQSAYSALLGEINGAPLVSMANTFNECAFMTASPEIPGSVTNLYFTFGYCSSLSTAPTIPDSVTNMNNAFYSCTALKTAPAIPDSVTTMSYTFRSCSNLTEIPTIGNGVLDMSGAFKHCTSLVSAPDIPDSVTNIEHIFSGCSSLKTAPTIGSSVTIMRYAFIDCYELMSAPTVPYGVTDLECTFSGCSSLITAPTIPDSVTNMLNTFSGCAALKTAPIIPSSVTDMRYTFSGCTALTGTVVINAQPTAYDGCFQYTEQPIVLSGSAGAEILQVLADTSGENVTLA